jgi:hypothetical protein
VAEVNEVQLPADQGLQRMERKVRSVEVKMKVWGVLTKDERWNPFCWLELASQIGM